MQPFDILVTAPTIVTSWFLCRWLIRYGHLPMGNSLHFFLRMFLGAAIVMAWSCAFDYFFESDWVTWLGHVMMNYVIVCAGAILSFIVSLVRPVRTV